MAFCVLIGSDTAGQQLIGSAQLLTFLSCWGVFPSWKHTNRDMQSTTSAHPYLCAQILLYYTDLNLILMLKYVWLTNYCQWFADVCNFISWANTDWRDLTEIPVSTIGSYLGNQHANVSTPLWFDSLENRGGRKFINIRIAIFWFLNRFFVHYTHNGRLFLGIKCHNSCAISRD